MKIIIVLFLFALSIQASWFQENETILEVKYILAYKNFKSTTDEDPKILKGIQYKLICNLNESRFEYIPAMSNDGVIENKRFISRGGKGIYYKNIQEKLKLRKIKAGFDDELKLVQHPFEEYDWTITKEKKKINGLLCYRAYTEYSINLPNAKGELEKVTNKVIVWFTPEINYPFGPAGYDGLPGLVLEKHSNSFYIIASEINYIDNKKNRVELRPTKGKEISKEEYNKEYDIFLKNLYKY